MFDSQNLNAKHYSNGNYPFLFALLKNLNLLIDTRFRNYLEISQKIVIKFQLQNHILPSTEVYQPKEQMYLDLYRQFQKLFYTQVLLLHVNLKPD